MSEPGADTCDVLEGSDVIRLEGTSWRDHLVAAYTVRCDPGWATRAVSIHLQVPQPERRLELGSDGDGRWWRDGVEAPDLEGCMDADLECTPATNTLPIRRLGLRVGEGAEVAAAWVRFPSLEVQRLDQRYERIAKDVFRYSSGSFRADLAVDEDGLALDYPGGWVRER